MIYAHKNIEAKVSFQFFKTYFVPVTKAFFTHNLTSIKVALKNYAIKKVISEKLVEDS